MLKQTRTIGKKENYLVKFAGEGLIMVAERQSLLEATLVAGIPMLHACGGQAKCSTCRVLVLKGYHSLSIPTEKEKM
ncbi:2Fe-2S iron-sulfur cluster-binding protein [Rhodocytophaga aerolata]|uniref:2Fe-2S iron-sulfur cluster-binding protein n=1 Tax=Rhodocytophaga aerolata TaxID=455078 RepID=A0ABT8RCY4_9BACT|nr:2Fe-2S iron-sulfur cluster-binding protein [Rhodocytophaga aerolata]MDO1449925.1 2Fe-2S iron-sulfur cluster-binding protein [Rhodocytophaga aerolata]